MSQAAKHVKTQSQRTPGNRQTAEETDRSLGIKRNPASSVATFAGRAKGFAEYHNLDARTANFMLSEAAQADALVAALREIAIEAAREDTNPASSCNRILNLIDAALAAAESQ